jgi:hypothetical protein
MGLWLFYIDFKRSLNSLFKYLTCLSYAEIQVRGGLNSLTNRMRKIGTGLSCSA